MIIITPDSTPTPIPSATPPPALAGMPSPGRLSLAHNLISVCAVSLHGPAGPGGARRRAGLGRVTCGNRDCYSEFPPLSPGGHIQKFRPRPPLLTESTARVRGCQDRRSVLTLLEGQ
eukprot:752888-Hanusia_phi.AAC.5